MPTAKGEQDKVVREEMASHREIGRAVPQQTMNESQEEQIAAESSQIA